jgi:hypothetical protein
MEIADVRVPEPMSGVPPWQDPQWLDQASAWIDERLAGAGLIRDGAPAARARMWSVVARVPLADGGCVWFKANPPKSAFEPALLAALGRWAPEMALPLVAVDVERAWTLSRDAGAHLGDLLRREPGAVSRLAPFVRRYAGLQIALGGRVEELLALGVPDLRPQIVADRFEALLGDAAVRAAVGRRVADLVGPGPGAMDGGGAQDPDEVWITEAQFAELHRAAGHLRAVCTELSRIGVPVSLDHSDLHPGNIVDIEGRTVPFDWGDASVAHPFSTLLVLRRSARSILGPEESDALREAYLAPWLSLGFTPDELRRAADLAVRIAPVSRALAWGRVFPCFAGSVEPGAQAARWLVHILQTEARDLATG